MGTVGAAIAFFRLVSWKVWGPSSRFSLLSDPTSLRTHHNGQIAKKRQTVVREGKRGK